jgi:8-oxo-dGTP diphosphatase
MEQDNVRVGVGVFVIKNGEFLIQLRHGSHDANTWCLPGGHLDLGESFEDTARREVKEETGLEITNVRFGAVTNDIFTTENKHYVTVWMLSDWKSGVEHITEPDKCLEQKWCTLETLPSPLFLPWNQLLKSEFIDDIKKQLSAS